MFASPPRGSAALSGASHRSNALRTSPRADGHVLCQLGSPGRMAPSVGCSRETAACQNRPGDHGDLMAGGGGRAQSECCYEGDLKQRGS